MKIFLDACAIIYWVEVTETFYTKLVKTLSQIRNKYHDATFSASFLSLLECRVHPMRQRNETLLKKYQQFFCTNDLYLVQLSLHIIEKATELRALYSIRTPDALQAASALSIADEVLFLTGDKNFKKIPGLNVKII